MAPTTRSMTGSLRKTQRYSPEPFQKARVKKRAAKKGRQASSPTKTKKKKPAPSKTKKPGAKTPAAKNAAAAPKKSAAKKPAAKRLPPKAPAAAKRWKTPTFPNLGPRTSPQRPTSAISTLTEMTSAISSLTPTSSTTGPVSDTIIDTVEVDAQGNSYSEQVVRDDDGGVA
ncbi:hypothetical protein B0A49_10637 [Cryomyces minteri]|uniref:Uncharacterized protein n=1 Tax=Cryomyces minteri TaxID=331657 RepID=A0A4U0WQY4_9PEZI|nr:hypothetical protein B0A49_10637 [Cryomyces minteri]